MDDPNSPDAPEHLVMGRHYLVFPPGDDRKDQRLTIESPMRLDRCGVWEDTPENRREIARGTAMNDSLQDKPRW
jgi:hypothetical protein